ncbi:MAG: hypothetical protein PUE38_04730, partial [Olsenella sp.]|nr:hypothetical protein [Olsenella sp.]
IGRIVALGVSLGHGVGGTLREVSNLESLAALEVKSVTALASTGSLGTVRCSLRVVVGSGKLVTLLILEFSLERKLIIGISGDTRNRLLYSQVAVRIGVAKRGAIGKLLAVSSVGVNRGNLRLARGGSILVGSPSNLNLDRLAVGVVNDVLIRASNLAQREGIDTRLAEVHITKNTGESLRSGLSCAIASEVVLRKRNGLAGVSGGKV